MQRTPKALLEGAQRYIRDLEGDVNTAQAYAQTDGDFVWMKMNEAKSKDPARHRTALMEVVTNCDHLSGTGLVVPRCRRFPGFREGWIRVTSGGW